MESRRDAPPHPAKDRTATGLALGLMLLVASWRVLLGWMTKHEFAAALPGWLPGFTPIAALAVGGGFLWPRRMGIVVPLGALFASDLALTAIYGQGMGTGLMLVRYGVLLGLAVIGVTLRGQGFGRVALVVGSLAGSVLFYVVTNTASWFGGADYTQSASGWWQALTSGLPGYPPSWVFFRNSLVSDAVVSMLLAATCLPWSRPVHHGHRLATGAAR